MSHAKSRAKTVFFNGGIEIVGLQPYFTIDCWHTHTRSPPKVRKSVILISDQWWKPSFTTCLMGRGALPSTSWFFAATGIHEPHLVSWFGLSTLRKDGRSCAGLSHHLVLVWECPLCTGAFGKTTSPQKETLVTGGCIGWRWYVPTSYCVSWWALLLYMA